jgi:hypothetical protein
LHISSRQAEARGGVRVRGPQRRSAPYTSADELKALYRFTDLQSFLAIYYVGMAVLRMR